MSIQSFQQANYGSDAFVDQSRNYALSTNASKFILGLWNRTGKGTGIVPEVADPVTATGADINTATQLTKDWNPITLGAANTGVKILPLKPGNDIVVLNKSGSAKNVYPPAGNIQIDVLAAGQPFALADGQQRTFKCWTLDKGQTTFFVSSP